MLGSSVGHHAREKRRHTKGPAQTARGAEEVAEKGRSGELFGLKRHYACRRCTRHNTSPYVLPGHRGKGMKTPYAGGREVMRWSLTYIRG